MAVNSLVVTAKMVEGRQQVQVPQKVTGYGLRLRRVTVDLRLVDGVTLTDVLELFPVTIFPIS